MEKIAKTSIQVIIVLLWFYLSAWLMKLVYPQILHFPIYFQVMVNTLVIPYFFVMGALWPLINKTPQKFTFAKQEISGGQLLNFAITIHGIGMMVVLITGTILNLLRLPLPTMAMADIPPYLNLIILLLINPIFEEYFFRKMLLPRSPFQSPKISALFNGLLFALPHYLNLGLIVGNRNLIIGAGLAYLYLNTGNIFYPIIAHGMINFVGAVIPLYILPQDTTSSAIYLAIAIVWSLISLSYYKYKQGKISQG